MSESDRMRIVDVFSGDVAVKALAGDWVRAMPVLADGYWRGGQRHDLSADVIRAIATNWARREEIGMPARPPVNVEHVDIAGAVGYVADLKAEADGLYIKLEPGEKGQEMLEAGAFSYLSAEIYWDYEVPTTGEQAGPVFAGVALTNYPFFGESTALYSRAATGHLLDRFQMGQEEADERKLGMARTDLLGLLGSLLNIIREIGWLESDLSWLSSQDGIGLANAAIREGQRPLVVLLAEAAQALPSLYSKRQLLELYAATKSGNDGTPYPASAWLEVPDAGNPERWSGRFKTYVQGELVTSRILLDAAARMPLLSEAAKDRLAAEYRKLGVTPPHLAGGATMDKTEGMPAPDEFTRKLAELKQELTTEFSTKIAAVTQERDTFAARVQALEGQLTAEQDGRLLERFTRQAEGFAALGAKTVDLAGHLAWLYKMDQSEGKAHFAYFETLLKTADGSLAQSAAFQATGTGAPGKPAGDVERFNALIVQKATAMGKNPSPTSTDYTDLVGLVAGENPELYSRVMTARQ